MEQLKKNWLIILLFAVVVLVAILKNRHSSNLVPVIPAATSTPTSPQQPQATEEADESDDSPTATGNARQCRQNVPFYLVEIGPELKAIEKGQQIIEVPTGKNPCLKESQKVVLFSHASNKSRQRRADAHILRMLPNGKMRVQIMDSWLGDKTVLPPRCFRPCRGVLVQEESLKKSGPDTTVLFFSPAPIRPPKQELLGQAKVQTFRMQAKLEFSEQLKAHADIITGKDVVIGFERPLNMYERPLRNLSTAVAQMKPKSLRWFYPGANGLDGTPIRAPIIPGYKWIAANKVKEYLQKNTDTKLLLLQAEWWKGHLEPKIPFTLVKVIPAALAPQNLQEAFAGNPKVWESRFNLGSIRLDKPQKVILMGHSNFDWNPYYLARVLQGYKWTDVQLVRGGADEFFTTQ